MESLIRIADQHRFTLLLTMRTGTSHPHHASEPHCLPADGAPKLALQNVIRLAREGHERAARKRGKLQTQIKSRAKKMSPSRVAWPQVTFTDNVLGDASLWWRIADANALALGRVTEPLLTLSALASWVRRL